MSATRIRFTTQKKKCLLCVILPFSLSLSMWQCFFIYKPIYDNKTIRIKVTKHLKVFQSILFHMTLCPSAQRHKSNTTSSHPHTEWTLRDVNPVNKISTNLAFPVSARLSRLLYPSVQRDSTSASCCFKQHMLAKGHINI